jgi:hypothetical protein
LTSAQTAAEALTQVSVVGSYLSERFWPDIYKQANDTPRPGFMPYANMGQQVACGLDEASTQKWLEQAKARETTLDDTHPALKDRLQAIGESPRLAPPAADQAADKLLGQALSSVTQTFDQRWYESIASAWAERHEDVQKNRKRLAELDEQAQRGELPLTEAIEQVRLMEFCGAEAEVVLAKFRELYQREPGNAMLCFSLGSRLLACDDEAGCDLLERAMALDEEATPNACEALRDYHWRNGRKELAQAWHERLLAAAEKQKAAQQERDQVLLSDIFEAHGLSEDVLAKLRDELRAVPGLRKAYLAKKQVKYAAHRPFYVLGYCVTGFFKFHSRKRAAEALAQIRQNVEFPGETIIFNVEGDNHRFERKFKRIKATRVL